MTTPLYTISQFPADDQAAMREFDDRYIGVIGAAQPLSWSDMGEFVPTNSPMVTFPISNLALKYQQTEGESRFRTILTKSFDVKAEQFDCGIQAKYLDLLQQTFAYKAWLAGPQRMMLAEARHRERAIITLLEDGENAIWGSAANPIDGVNFFSASHLSDFGDPNSATWSNYQSSTKDVVNLDNIKAEVSAMQAVRDENGDELGADPDTILVPTAKYESLKFLLAQNMVLSAGTSTSNTGAGVSNAYFGGKFNVVRVPFTDANDWYLVDSKLMGAMGLAPWLSLRYTVPDPLLELRHWDTSSDFFKDTDQIKVSSHLWTGAALTWPQAIRKVKGA